MLDKQKQSRDVTSTRPFLFTETSFPWHNFDLVCFLNILYRHHKFPQARVSIGGNVHFHTQRARLFTVTVPSPSAALWLPSGV